jgi:iron(III) transport system permease protein
MGLFAIQFIPPLLNPATPLWSLIRDYWLADIMIQTISLIVWTGLLTMVLGVFAGYVVTFYTWRYRRVLDVLLILPLAIPTYLLGYIYTTMTGVTGSIHRFLDYFVPSQQPLIQLFNLPGAVLLFSLSLYPYVYVAVRAFLRRQPGTMFLMARSLGQSQGSIFFRIVLPLLRPAIVASVTLVMLEVLNDYGLVQYLGLRVYATAIFQSWFNGNDIDTAIRLSLTLIGLITLVLVTESFLRKQQKYAYSQTQIKPLTPLPLPRSKRVVFSLILFLLILLAFVIPVIQVISWTMSLPATWLTWSYFSHALSTLILAFYAMVVIMICAVAITNFHRFADSKWKTILIRVASLGYAIPGTIIAISAVLLFVPIDQWLAQTFNVDYLLLSSSLIVLIISLVIRFLAVALNLVESAYQKIGTKFTLASYALGKGKIATFFKVDLPLINHGVIVASLIVMIDLMKELPLTLILRPFNFNTLATTIFQYAGDEQIIASAPTAFLLIALTSVIVILASDMMFKVNVHES